MQTSTDRTFVLNQKLMSVSGDLWIEDMEGNRLFEVDGKAFSIRRRHELLDASGHVVYEISQALAHLRRTFEIKRDGHVVATIEQAILAFLGDRFTINMADGSELIVHGDIIDREFRIARGDEEVILASRRLISIRDAYGIQVAPGFDVPLALAIVIALEQMEREGREQSSEFMHH